MELTEAFLAKIAGWEAMKRARALWERGAVVESRWTAPRLEGAVRDGPTTYRAGLVFNGPVDVENLCPCRDSRGRGLICAHSVAVGLDQVRPRPAPGGEPTPVLPDRVPERGTVAPEGAASGESARCLRRSDRGGEPLELHVIFPPNLPQALGRGRVMVCVEGQWRRGRVPLAALPRTTAFQLSAQDAALLDQIEAISAGAAALMLSSVALAALLEILVGHPRSSLGKTRKLEVAGQPWAVPVNATLEPSGEIVLRVARGTVLPPLVFGKTTWVLDQTVFRPVALPPEFGELLRGPLRLERARVPRFLNVDWPAWSAAGEFSANFQLENFALDTAPPGFGLELAGGLSQLQARLDCVYGSERVAPARSTEPMWLPDPACANRYFRRDLDAERAAVARLLRAGFGGPDVQGRYLLSGQNAVLNFFARDFPRLRLEWQVTVEERLGSVTRQNLERIEPVVKITSSGVQWFDFDVIFAVSSGETLSPADVQRLLHTGQSYHRLRNGRLALLDTGAVQELQETLVDCAPQQQAGGYRVSAAHAGFLEATLRERNGWAVQAPSAWRERLGPGDAALDCPPLGAIEPVLRPYQKHGVAWLHFLRRNGFGGILADEMGLGKTLQTLAFLQSVKGTGALDSPGRRLAFGRGDDSPSASRAAESRPSLVVCPTSLVFNWVAESRKFTPDLRVLALHGPDRHGLFEQIGRRDLVVTSYALLRRDAERYRGLEFDTVVLDEAQHIKNRQTQNAQAVKAVRSRQRLVLTGTPLENSVLDLWSIFDFLMPGYLGTAPDFRERYEVPIARDRNPEAQARLSRRLRPFLLRRLKRDVAPDLPEKLEQVVRCDLTEAQRVVYRQVMETGRREMLEAVGAQGLARSRLVIFNALLRLRQICCDLRLLKLENVDPATASGKLDLFAELLEEALDGGHRVLVFSQFVSMLRLLRQRLEADAVGFCYLDGSTINRAEVVQRFQSRPEIPVFLISLKAGGLGLNLSAADTVIHFDPWWNPAVEQQATDRAHRLGQTRVVTSYQLIARGTVEEKILGLQHRKREVIRATLGAEELLAETLTWEEVQALFAE